MNKQVYKAGRKQYNPKTEKTEFIVIEQLLKPQPQDGKKQLLPKDSFLPTQKGGVISHQTLISNGFTDEMITELIERGVLHLPKAKNSDSL